MNPFRYRGYYYDTETGLYYLQSRYYDPETGRFINADAQFDSGITGKNLFVYCNNNPVSSIDPDGKKAMQTVIDLISQYSDAIISEGKEYCVYPVVIAGCIFVEQLNNVNFLDTFDVAAGVIYNIDTSIGIGQVKISTAKLIEDKGYIETSKESYWFIFVFPRRYNIIKN